jgi:acetyl/propionyl-CoA carboxylase alpha subunit
VSADADTRLATRLANQVVRIGGIAGRGGLVLGDRDCSVQRRHHKLIDEVAAPSLGADLRQRIHDSDRAIRRVRYPNAGTVEFVVDDTTGEYFFLEVDARPRWSIRSPRW